MSLFSFGGFGPSSFIGAATVARGGPPAGSVFLLGKQSGGPSVVLQGLVAPGQRVNLSGKAS